MYPERPTLLNFRSISHSILVVFRGNVVQLVVQRDVPNLRFCWQARYFGGFAGVATTPEIDPVRRKIASTMVRERAVRTTSGVCRSWARLSVEFGHLGAPLNAPGRCPHTSSTDLGHLDRSRSTDFDRLGCLDRLRNTHFVDLGSYRANYRASLRSGQVSRFPAALGSPSGQVDLARYRASLPRSAHQRYD